MWVYCRHALLAVGATLALAGSGWALESKAQWQVGEFEVFALPDTRLPQSDPTQQSGVAYAIRKGRTVVLINAGRGARQGHDLGLVAENLKSVGIAPDEVSAVFLTSMHADLVGGLLAPNAQRQYKNAQLFASAAAMQYWLADYSYVQAPDDQKVAFATTITSVMPYVQAGKLHAVDEGIALVPGLKVLPLSGPTPGCVGYLIESGGQKLLIPQGTP